MLVLLIRAMIRRTVTCAGGTLYMRVHFIFLATLKVLLLPKILQWIAASPGFLLRFVPNSTFLLLSLHCTVNINPNITRVSSLSATQTEPHIFADIYKNFTNKKALIASTSLRIFVFPRNIWKSRFPIPHRYIKCQGIQDSLFRDTDSETSCLPDLSQI